MKNLESTGPGPFRKGAAAFLFYWSWIYLFMTQLDMAVAFPEPQMHLFYFLFKRPDWVYALPWPLMQLLPFVLIGLLGGLITGGIRLAFNRLFLRLVPRKISFEECYREAATFMIANRRFFLVWAAPFLVAVLLAIPALAGAINLEDSILSGSLPIYLILAVFYLSILWYLFWDLASIPYYHLVSEGRQWNWKDLVKKVAWLFVLITLLGLVLHGPVSIFQWLLEDWEYVWIVLKGILEIIDYIITLFILIFMVLYVIREGSFFDTLKRSYLFFNSNFFTLLRLLLDILRRAVPAAFLVFLYWYWVVQIWTSLPRLLRSYLPEDAAMTACLALLDAIAAPAIWIEYRWGWVFLVPLAVIPLMWLRMVAIMVIRGLDDLDRDQPSSDVAAVESGG